ncbi:5-methylcytosine-specific restriction endonuclease system specificity protein McrC [Brachybacterium paraconglomeratum]|uniref:5-methylcytosine-specific restriction endonuclease system specificity protein McrC n=1 Tax=Brachybacterium paraconglomeratum TaxID=173362 RepID=UPI0031ECA23C
MTPGPIAIRNIYVMMAYAFGAMRDEGKDRIASEPFDHLHDLLAEILVRGVGAEVKRGLHRDYRRNREDLATVRGRIDITGTIATRSTVKGRLVCEFDEYEIDTPHNRVLKSVIVLLIRSGQIATSRKGSLRRLLPYLNEVTLIAPTSIRWATLTYHRANVRYRMLMGVCELIVRGLLPTRASGTTDLAAWISDDAMSTLYERFLREYYAFHHPELSPRASHLAWDYDHESAVGAAQLPAMRTDVTLRRDGRVLIIDAKYYSQTLQSRWEKETIHSGNLYQMLAYVKNADIDRSGAISGLLLYARTGASTQPDLDVMIQGNRVGARSLDLDTPWEEIRSELEGILRWLDA